MVSGCPGLCGAAEIPSLSGTWALGSSPTWRAEARLLAPPQMPGGWGQGPKPPFQGGAGKGLPGPVSGRGRGRASAPGSSAGSGGGDGRQGGRRSEPEGRSPAPPLGDPPCSPLSNEAGEAGAGLAAAPATTGLADDPSSPLSLVAPGWRQGPGGPSWGCLLCSGCRRQPGLSGGALAACGVWGGRGPLRGGWGRRGTLGRQTQEGALSPTSHY